MKARMSDKMKKLLDDYRKRYRPRWIDLSESLLDKKVKENEFVKKLKDEYELAQHEYVECLEREMKVKSDYVTNSSSVSFAGWGIELFEFSNDDDIPKKFLDEVYNYYLEHCEKHKISKLSIDDFCTQALGAYNRETFENLVDNGEEVEINRWYFEFFKIIAEKYNLFCEINSFGSEFIIGKSSLEIPDDMTARFYKEFIKAKLEKLGFDKERMSEIFTIIER
jgi:hypothetical protein